MTSSNRCWLRVEKEVNELFLIEFDLFDSLERASHFKPDTRPSLVTLLGISHPSVLSLFSATAPKPAEVHLNCTKALFSTDIVFVANGPVQGANRAIAQSCKSRSRKISLRFKDPETAVHKLYTGILYPLSDVVCSVVEDFAKINSCIAELARLLVPDVKEQSYTHIIIFVPSRRNCREIVIDRFQEMTSKRLLDLVQEIHVMELPRSRKLRQEALVGLSTILKQTRSIRQMRRHLFKADHFKALLQYACDHLSRNPGMPFDIIQAARYHNPVATDLSQHISNFLKNFQNLRDVIEFGIPYIASSLLLDSFPPGSHMFDPHDVFRSLYYQSVHSSSVQGTDFPESQGFLLRSGFTASVENSFAELFAKLAGGSLSTADFHAESMHKIQAQLKVISERSTCLSCIRQRPQYKMPCGHFICENCLVIFNQPTSSNGTFLLYRCFICNEEISESVQLKVHPPTAGASILSIDGGGVRGILPLTFLRMLEEEIDLPIPIQHFFKITLGISSGAIIVLALFSNGWSIEKSIRRFKDLSKTAFKARKVLNVPILSYIQKFVTALFQDSIYPATHIEDALRKTFGNNELFDSSFATSNGIKIGVPVATVEGESVCLFNNYNGIGDHKGLKEYHVLGPESIQKEVKVWEVARSSSAALAFFPPKDVPGVGTFQDPGPLINDPVVEATTELSALFPHTKEPDFVLSIGTGVSNDYVKDTATVLNVNYRKWRYRSLLRYLRMSWKRMSDRPIKQILSKDERYHRLDFQLGEKEPRLDDVSSIESLENHLENDITMPTIIRDVARHAIASLFYFELDDVPSRFGGVYDGYGSIRCSLTPDDKAYDPLMAKLSQSHTRLYIDERPLQGSIFRKPFRSKEVFCKKFKLQVTGQFSILLKQSGSEACHISGSPFTVERLAQAQELFAPFGRSNHQCKRRSEGMHPMRKRRRLC